MTASSCGLCVAQLGKSKATEVESIKIASVSCLSSLSHAFNFFPPSPILPCTGIFHLNFPPPPLQMEIHSTPSSSCSSSSSHLIPPPLSGPEPRQQDGGWGWVRGGESKTVRSVFLATSCTLKINSSTILTLCANFCDMLLLNPFFTQR